MQLVPYLNFAGNCKEALGLYSDALNGKIEYHMLYSEQQDICKNLPANWHNKIMHAVFRAGEIFFMASDIMEGDNGSCGVNKLVPEGSPVALSLNFDDENKQTEVFNKLAHGGNIIMPLQDTFWGARFGMLTDKFGIRWMFNYDKPQG